MRIGCANGLLCLESYSGGSLRGDEDFVALWFDGYCLDCLVREKCEGFQRLELLYSDVLG